jgi:predicted ATP-dependent endonuclease of OLD family
MVKIGFIVEGDTEKILFSSSAFQNYLNSININYIPQIINAEGNGNLLPHNISEYTQTLIDKGAEKIFIITDLDSDECVTKTKKRIKPNDIHQCIISRKTIESWFLADTQTIRKYLNSADYICETPETLENPFQEIKNQRMAHINKGVSDKKILVKTLLNLGLSFESIISNPNCNSAKYFHNKLIQYSNN